MSRLAATMRKIIEETEVPQPCEVVECDGIDKVLNERGSRYGKFSEHALITQNIKAAMRHSPNWNKLPEDMKEALEMVAHKVGRILNGDPEYPDNVVDIIGYMQLVLDRMMGVRERGVQSKMGKPNGD